MESKLCDFGFARLVSETNEKLTDYVATRWYRAPELLLSQGNYGKEVDYWAIGCIMGELVDGNPLFPGENELDQLHCIQKVLGNLTDKQEEMFYSNPLFNGKNLLNISKPETLEKRYLGKFSKKAISFMKGLLALDPKKRLNGNTVFKHAYFEKLVLADLQKEHEQRLQMQNERSREEQRLSMKNKINAELINKGILNNIKNEKRDHSQNSKINIMNNNEISQMMSTRLIQKNNSNSTNKILVMNVSNPKINDISTNENNSSNINHLNNNNVNSIINNNYSNTMSTVPQNPTNITNINIINYNNYEENHSQGNNSNNNTINKNLLGNNSKKKYTNIKKKDKEKNQNSISMKKFINKMATSINFNQKNKNNPNYVSFVSPGIVNNNKETQNNNNSNNILDNAYKTFYKKNKEKDIYNIELDLQNYNPNDSNDNMRNYMKGRKYDVINEEEEFTKEEKIKLKQLASLYKNSNIVYSKQNSSEKNNKNKYNSKISPNKNQYYYHPNKTGYNKNGFHLPVIQKGNVYNNILNNGDYKKYAYH